MYTAFLLGLAGSLHCVGMCGPIVLALPLPAAARRQVAVQASAYHAGRILTYSALGLGFGLLGKGLVLAGMQQIASIVAGALMLFAAVFMTRWERLLTGGKWFSSFTIPLQNKLGRLLRHRPSGASFAVGLLNGLLPCGMVYLALAGAITSSDAWHGALFMAMFGLGTAPLMIGASVAGQTLKADFRRRFRLVQPFLLAIAGILLLVRGLQLDLSLFESAVPPANLDCH
ncbi:MAG: sulfite exporter TauE/SafE family protein [Saprospiraceae bacterium]|nr:sulfite exporter TauE/SafE family protein [Saprospiraceae bacterium]MCC7505578.1 sulfite exporter TauE/SafE family protein [Saprospiraceae bacterium]